MHLLIFWGVIIQVIGTAIKIMQMGLFVPFTWPLFSGGFYFAYELIMDLAGAAILIGVMHGPGQTICNPIPTIWRTPGMIFMH